MLLQTGIDQWSTTTRVKSGDAINCFIFAYGLFSEYSQTKTSWPMCYSTFSSVEARLMKYIWDKIMYFYKFKHQQMTEKSCYPDKNWQ